MNDKKIRNLRQPLLNTLEDNRWEAIHKRRQRVTEFEQRQRVANRRCKKLASQKVNAVLEIRLRWSIAVEHILEGSQCCLTHTYL